MKYINRINSALAHAHHDGLGYTALDLFAGCGGMSLGFEAAGFDTIGIELNHAACSTYNLNLRGPCYQARLPLSSAYPLADVIIAGPPCQPFSVLGNRLGRQDNRDGFPAVLEAVSSVMPRAVIVENVKGILQKSPEYVEHICTSLERLGYAVVTTIANASSFEVPQNRERFLIVGTTFPYSLPKAHRSRLTCGYALSGVRVANSRSLVLTEQMDAYIHRYELASKCRTPRDLDMRKPSRTVTCRNLAGSTGDMLRVCLPRGERRRLSVREAARLQSFPDWFEFTGTSTEQFYQIGNAVPPMLSYHFAQSLAAAFVQADMHRNVQRGPLPNALAS